MQMRKIRMVQSVQKKWCRQKQKHTALKHFILFPILTALSLGKKTLVFLLYDIDIKNYNSNHDLSWCAIGYGQKQGNRSYFFKLHPV